MLACGPLGGGREPATATPCDSTSTTAADTLADSSPPRRSLRRRALLAAVSAAAGLLVSIAVWRVNSYRPELPTAPQAQSADTVPGDGPAAERRVAPAGAMAGTTTPPRVQPQPVHIPETRPKLLSMREPPQDGAAGDHRTPPGAVAPQPDTDPNASGRPPATSESGPQPVAHRASSTPSVPGRDRRAGPNVSGGAPVSVASVVEFIDERVAAAWREADVEPSPVADDAEWFRRVHLDLVGRIPPRERLMQFLKDRSPDKRRRWIDRLLDDREYVDHWATIWTNTLIGRAGREGASREALQQFLRQAFHQNRPWNEIAYEFIAAEGDAEENGATNFLLAHLNNQAVPATAITARVFLGLQLQCTQCHDHPFNDWKQIQFWQFNSFFQQATRVVQRAGAGGRRVKLIDRPAAGPTYFEDRRGLMHVALPEFAGHAVQPRTNVRLRAELARIVAYEENRQLARAFVNRTWKHFFGYAFTAVVDDMGPHAPVSHPELLEGLADAFIASGFDVKQLIRWICNSRPYQLTSAGTDRNAADDPAKGTMPLFTRMYPRAMSAEQVYDSILTAAGLTLDGDPRWETARQRRTQWIRRFVMTYDTEENDEAVVFAGTIPQALDLMNGELVEQILTPRPNNLLGQLMRTRQPLLERLDTIALAVVSRHATHREREVFAAMLRRSAAQSGNRTNDDARLTLLQDAFWAYLNSAEFVIIH